MSKLKETIVRVMILLIGLAIAHLGVTLFLLANLGADPFNVLVQGTWRFLSNLINAFPFTHGQVHIAISLLIILVLLVVDKSYIRIGTLLCMIFGGPFIDFFTILLDPIFQKGLALPLLILVNVLGCSILAFGMTIVIKSEAGTGPNDLVAVVLSDKRKWKFSYTRIGVDVLFAGCGWLFGGTVGLGTLICAFVVGPVAGFFMPLNEAWIRQTLSKLK